VQTPAKQVLEYADGGAPARANLETDFSWAGCGRGGAGISLLGPEKAAEVIRKLRVKLPPSELKVVASARSRLPTWMAQEISALVADS